VALSSGPRGILVAAALPAASLPHGDYPDRTGRPHDYAQGRWLSSSIFGVVSSYLRRAASRALAPSEEIIGAGLNETATPAFKPKTRTARGRFYVGEPVAMRRRTLVPLDRMEFPLTLAGGLRTAFADVVSTPLPECLAALMRRLSADRDERSGETEHGATQTSSRIDRRGRRRTPQPDGARPSISTPLKSRSSATLSIAVLKTLRSVASKTVI
jgi:hypothetical protein